MRQRRNSSLRSSMAPFTPSPLNNGKTRTQSACQTSLFSFVMDEKFGVIMFVGEFNKSSRSLDEVERCIDLSMSRVISLASRALRDLCMLGELTGEAGRCGMEDGERSKLNCEMLPGNEGWRVGVDGVDGERSSVCRLLWLLPPLGGERTTGVEVLDGAVVSIAGGRSARSTRSMYEDVEELEELGLMPNLEGGVACSCSMSCVT